ncbi:Asx homology domain-containing protein [Whalleya microplaca]|nr:Asx homology domain-containing protein [Whalleya microplaca]
MPPRKTRSSATANGDTSEATRKSPRAVKTPSRHKVEDSSSDELSNKKPPQDEVSNEMGPIADEIVVKTYQTASQTSRPSSAKSAKSEAASEGLSIRATPDKKVRFDVPDDEGEGDELAGEQPTTKKPKITIKKASADSRKGRSKYDNPDEMLTNPRSPLGTAKLRNLLCSSKAWDILTQEEKLSILSKFPDSQEITTTTTNAGEDGDAERRPNIAALRNNDNFRHDIARYQAGLRDGRHDPEWIRQAQAAHRKREIGFYNEYLAAKFEEDWGLKMPGQQQQEQEQEEQEEKGEKEEKEEGEEEEEAAVVAGGSAVENGDHAMSDEGVKDDASNSTGGNDDTKETVKGNEPLGDEGEVQDAQSPKDGKGAEDEINIKSGDGSEKGAGVEDKEAIPDRESPKAAEDAETKEPEPREAINHNGDVNDTPFMANTEDEKNAPEPMDVDVQTE